MNSLRKEQRKNKMKNETMTYRKKARDGRKIWKTVTKKERKERKMEMNKVKNDEQFEKGGEENKMKKETMTYRKKARDGRNTCKTVTKKERKERKMEMKRETKYKEFDGQGKDKVKEDG